MCRVQRGEVLPVNPKTHTIPYFFLLLPCFNSVSPAQREERKKDEGDQPVKDTDCKKCRQKKN